MSDKPILFSAPMVRALLNGRKTQTRRILKQTSEAFEAPKLRSGDRFWVREHWKACAQMDAIPPRNMSKGEPILYLADNMVREIGCMMIKPGRHRHGMHMPRWASRLTLIVTGVRVQRLQDIDAKDVCSEGSLTLHPNGDVTPRAAFIGLWDSINAERGAGWDINPMIVAYTFTVTKENIEKMGA
jgi:hypothetical protein